MANRAPYEPYSITCDPEVINRVGLTNRAGRSSLTRFFTGVGVKHTHTQQQQQQQNNNKKRR